MAAPIPDEAPVTTTRRPSKSSAPGASYVSGIDLIADAGFKTDLDEGLVDFEGLGG